MFEKLNKKLEQKKYKDILALNEDIYDFKNDTIDLYAGETLEVLKIDSDCNIFSIKEDTILKNHPTYIEGVLSLIFREFLFIIETLSDDLIENIQIRSIYALNEIKQFLNRLGDELGKPWVKEYLKMLSEEELKNIENQIDEELSREALEVEEGKIDTELMENIITPSGDTLPDLGNIPELEVSGESSDKNKNAEEKNELEEAAVLKPEGDIVIPEISESKLEQVDGGPIYLNLQTNSDLDVTGCVSSDKDSQSGSAPSPKPETESVKGGGNKEVNNNTGGKADKPMDVDRPSVSKSSSASI